VDFEISRGYEVKAIFLGVANTGNLLTFGHINKAARKHLLGGSNKFLNGRLFFVLTWIEVVNLMNLFYLLLRYPNVKLFI